MRLRWTVVDTTGVRPSTQHVLVRCPRGTRLGEVVATLPPAPPQARHAGRGTDGGTVEVRVCGSVVAQEAVVGLPPLLDGAVLEIGTPGPSGPPQPPALLELVVTAGPDAGTVLPLPGRRATVGRSTACDLPLRDPRLSRHHCTLTVATDGVHVQDCGSTNGTGPTGSPPPVLRLGAQWHLGSGTLRLRAAAGTPGADAEARELTVTDRGDGTRELRPPPRARTPEVSGELRLPAPARPGRAGAFPLLAVALPALAAGGLAWWTGSVVYLALAALGPLLVVGSWWTARRDARREGTLGRRAHARACAELDQRARAAATALAAARTLAMPDAAALLAACTDLAGPLWERHHHDEDALRVRLGPALPPEQGTGHADLLRRVRTVDHEDRVTEVATGADLLAADLRDGALGVVHTGEDPGLARFLVGQLVALLPPASLTLVPVLGRAAEPTWAWLRLLPHVAPRHEQPGAGAGGALRDVLGLVAARREAVADPRDAHAGSTPVLVVVHDPDGELDGADLEALAGAGRLGVHVLVVTARADRLPRLCTQVVAPASPDGVDGRLTRLADGAGAVAVLDRVAASWSSRLARALAPLRLAAPDEAGSLPAAVALEDLLDLRPAAVAHRWAAPPDGLPVPLGVGPRGPLLVDLTTAGPHALVAGTTGAGKSELLRSWVLSLAATQPPDRLALLLVDYKGGATFDALARLPHCVGLLTDLDGGASARVLHSLQAEVRRRERLLARAGARDLRAYRALGGGGPEPVPRLLVVVDEFRVLAEDAPHVLGQFVRLAATGRSLGIHLVLATQRPGGVVSADIRANSALRIALRVQDPAESRDVVDRPDAAWLPPSSPGRAVVVGAGVDAVVQTAWTGGTPAGPLVSVVPAGEHAGHGGRAAVPDGGGGEPGTGTRTGSGDGSRSGDGTGSADWTGSGDGAAAVVSAVREASVLSGAAPARRPWLPPLPPVVRSLDAVEGLDGYRSAGSTGLVLGVADVPRSQARRPVTWSPLEDGPLLVLGTARSGRSTTLAAVARAAARAGTPVVRVSAASGCEDHVLDVLASLCAPPAQDPGQDPGQDPAQDGASGTPDPPGARGGPPRPGVGSSPRVLLLLDDVDQLLDPGAEPTAADLLLRLVRSGHREGVGIALAGGRALAASRVGGAARARLVHRTLDRADALMAGVPATAPAPSSLPGRCLVVGLHPRAPHETDPTTARTDRTAAVPGPPGEHDGDEVLEAQVLLPPAPAGTCPPPPTPTPQEQARPQPQPCPPPLPTPPAWLPAPLPRQLGVDVLPPPASDLLPVGLRGDGTPWLLDLRPGGLVVVAGSPGSGRSTTLHTVRLQALAAGLRVSSPWDGGGRSEDGVRDPTSPFPADELRPARPPVDVLLVDDVDRLEEGHLVLLEQWLRTPPAPAGRAASWLAPGATVVVAGATSWFADSFRGLPVTARQLGRGLVLRPGRTDVRDVLGARGAPVQLQQHPGRGLLVERGQVQRVQVARARGQAPSTPPGRIPSAVTPTGGPLA